MKISELLKLLKEAEAECGDLPVLFVTGGGEYTPEKVSLVKARVSAVHFGSITGPHQTQPDRIVISGKGMF